MPRRNPHFSSSSWPRPGVAAEVTRPATGERVRSRGWVPAVLLLSLLPALAIAATPDAAVQRVADGAVEVRLRVQPTQTTTAGTIVAELEVTAPTAFAMEISTGVEQRRGQLTVASESILAPVTLRPGMMQYRRRVVYRPFLGGTYAVPPFTVAYHSGTIAAQLVTAPVPLTVQSVIEGDPAVAKPAGLVPVEPASAAANRAVIWWIAGVVCVVALGGGWFFFQRRQKRKRITAAAPPPFGATLATVESLPAHDVRGLEHAIESLRAQQLNPLPAVLREAYQWIRFGSPTGRDVERFRESYKDYLRSESRAEAAKEAK